MVYLIVDSNYELPIEYELTKASYLDEKKRLKIIKRCETMEADKAYDDTKLLRSF